MQYTDTKIEYFGTEIKQKQSSCAPKLKVVNSTEKRYNMDLYEVVTAKLSDLEKEPVEVFFSAANLLYKCVLMSVTCIKRVYFK